MSSEFDRHESPRYACGALVRGRIRLTSAQRSRIGAPLGTVTTYRCRIVPRGAGPGCCPDHSRAIQEERRLREAQANAHKSGLSASKDWRPREPRPSLVDTHYAYYGNPEAAQRDFGEYHPEVLAWDELYGGPTSKHRL